MDFKEIRKNLIVNMISCVIGVSGVVYLCMMFCSLAIELWWSELVMPLLILGAVVFPVFFSMIAAGIVCYYMRLARENFATLEDNVEDKKD